MAPNNHRRDSPRPDSHDRGVTMCASSQSREGILGSNTLTTMKPASRLDNPYVDSRAHSSRQGTSR